MEIINNICGKGTAEISDALQKAFSERSEAGYIMHPMVFAEKYVKNENGELVKHQMYGLIRQPIVMHDTTDEGDNTIHVLMTRNELIYRIGNGEWVKTKDNLQIPISSKVIDVEKAVQSGSYNVAGIESLREENIFKLYLGDSAYACLERTIGQKTAR